MLSVLRSSNERGSFKLRRSSSENRGTHVHKVMPSRRLKAANRMASLTEAETMGEWYHGGAAAAGVGSSSVAEACDGVGASSMVMRDDSRMIARA